MSKLSSQLPREYKKPKLGIGNRVRISKYDLPFSEDYKPQLTEIFEIVAISTKKHPTYTIKDEQKKVILGKFQRKKKIRVI